MPRVIYQEYRDQFENSKYPFMDTANLKDSSGELIIPDNVFLDAGFCFPSGFPYLSKIVINASSAVFTVESDGDEATCEVSLSDLPDVLHFKTSSKKALGCLVSEAARLSWFASLPTGEYTFYPENTSFATRCNIPSRVLGVSTISADNSSLSGDVWLVGADGVFLRKEGNAVRIDILGEVLYNRAKCNDPRAYKTPNYLRSINGVEPDAYGNIFIGLEEDKEASRVRLTTTSGGITIERI